MASEDECKVVSLCHTNVIGYTGLAKLCGVPAHEWIAVTLAKASCQHAGQASDVLAQAAKAALSSIPKHLRRQAFLMCGWAPFEPDHTVKPHFCLISNFHDEAVAPTAAASEDFRQRIRTLRPGEPAAVFAIGEPLDARREAEILRSIRQTIDRRNGKGKKKKETGKEDDKDDKTFSRSVSIGKDAYSITITARGKTKRLIDSSHDHETGTMKDVKPTDIVRRLAKNFKVEIDDQAGEAEKIEKARFRDGASPLSEIVRFTRPHNLLAYETREGKLKVAKPEDQPSGVDLVMGENILEFSAEQGEDQENSEITVKGQRTGSKNHGKDAIQRKKTAKQSGNSEDYAPYTVQLDGDATDERLKKRLELENRQRQEASKTITVDVFHVQNDKGDPWDIDVKHYVECPPENIYEVMIVDELEYDVQNKDTIKTSLTLVADAKSKGGRSDSQAKGQARQAKMGVANVPGLYPDPWEIISMIFE